MNQSVTVAPPKEKGKAGRPLGSMSKLAHEARAAAQATGELPHEFLLRVARGEPMMQKRLVESIDQDSGEVVQSVVEALVVPDLERRVDAAKAAAPYFAPKISTVEIISGVSDDDLDSIIKSAAAEAGVSLGVDREGQTDETEEVAIRPRVRIIAT